VNPLLAGAMAIGAGLKEDAALQITVSDEPKARRLRVCCLCSREPTCACHQAQKKW